MGIINIPGYHSWRGMIERCKNPNHDKYGYYGGRGITVCERWNNFKTFLEDMGEKPSPKHSIDRINVNEGYSPNNCKWSTQSEQTRNTKINVRNKSGVRGVSWHSKTSTWYVAIGIGTRRLNLGYFKNFDDAVKARKEAEDKYW